MQYIADQLKMNASIVGLFKDGITVEQLKHYIANAPIENLYKYAQKIPEDMATGTGDEPPKQWHIVKVDSAYDQLPDNIKNVNPALMNSGPEFMGIPIIESDISGALLVTSGAKEYLDKAFQEEIAKRIEAYRPAKDMIEGGVVEPPNNFITNPDSIEFVAPLNALDDFLTGRLTVRPEEIKPLKKLHDKVINGEIKFKPTE